MATPSEIARAHQERIDRLASRTSAQVVRLFRQIEPDSIEAGWTAIAPTVVNLVSRAQVNAAAQANGYLTRIAGESLDDTIVPEAFAGVTKEGRAVAPEMYSAITTTKRLIGAGAAIPAAFRAGAGLMSLIAANVVRDSSRSADSTAGVANGFLYSVRVISPGACSRCAILAGVKGYRADFKRHPGCRCSSMPLRDTDTPDGVFRHPQEYFESLSAQEQARIFTKSGAEAIRLGADPAKVVNARRGAYKSSVKRPDGSFAPSRLTPVTIGRKADGTPLQVYATAEGNTARSSWARAQQNFTKSEGDRYRRTQTLRLMPEQIMSMASTPERARELLARYGYIT